jgi:O-antigen ligase
MSSPIVDADPAASALPRAEPSPRASTWLTRERALLVSVWALGLMLVLPFLAPFKAPPIASFHPEAMAAVLGLLALSVLPLFAARLEMPRIALLPLSIIVLIALQLVQGKLLFHQVGLLAALYLLWATALICLGGLLRRELGLERVLAQLAWFLLIGALASALMAWAQHIDSDALGPFMMPRAPVRVWANLGQSNQLADYLALGLGSAAFLYATARMRLRWAVPTVAALTYVLSLTGSRASWVYLLGFIAVSVVFFMLERSQANRRLLGFSAGALLALAAVPWLVDLLTPGLADVTMSASARLDPAVFEAEERPRIWKAAWIIFQQAPIFGVGLRQFGWQHFVVNAQLPAPRVTGLTDHAHNLPLHVLAELGVIGVSLLVVSTALWVAGLLRQPRTASHWWLWTAAMVLGVHSMLEYPLWYTFFLGVAAVIVGMGDARTIKLSLFQQGRSGRWLLLALVGIGWLVLGQLVRDYLFLENFLAFRYRYMHATAEVNSQAKDLLLTIHRGSLLSPYVEFGLSRAISLDAERLEDKLKVNGRAMRLFPTDDMVYREAMLLGLHGDTAQARLQWNLAAASYPEEEERALRVVQRRVDDGLKELVPLLEYAQSRGAAGLSNEEER